MNPGTDSRAPVSPATDDLATDDLATDNLATDNRATDNRATDNPATHNRVTGAVVVADPRAGIRLLAWRIAFVAVVAVHLVVLYWPRAPSTGGLPIDKVVHATIFGVVLWAGARAGVPVRPLIAVLLAHAVVSELIQHFLLAHRDGDPLDSLADITGVAIVTLLLRRRL